MSNFNELLPKILEISKGYSKNFNDDLKVALECLTKFEEEFQKGRARGREQSQKNKNQLTALQSINEDEDDQGKNKKLNNDESYKSCTDATELEPSIPTESRTSGESNNGGRRKSKKRSKHEVDGMCSPELDKRQKRNASVKAQSIISKQVNVNLTQKLRRGEPEEAAPAASRSRRKNQDDKENKEPLPTLQIKLEKVSILPEPVEEEASLPANVDVKKEVDKDGFAMPAVPVPMPRRAAAGNKDLSSENADEEQPKRRNTKTRKPTDTMPPPPVPATRATRASSRASSRVTKNLDAEELVPVEPRPKRTRAKKKASESSTTSEPEKETPPLSSQENGIASPNDKPRPKRTRRAQKAAEKAEEIVQEVKAVEKETLPVEKIELVKQERVSLPEISSPILHQKETDKSKAKLKGKGNKLNEKENDKNQNQNDKYQNQNDKNQNQNDKNQNQNDKNVKCSTKEMSARDVIDNVDVKINLDLDMDKTRVIANACEANCTVTLTDFLDKTVNLPKEGTACMNGTVVLESCSRDTMVLDKPSQNHHAIMDATVVIDKDHKPCNMTEDESILTDDSSDTEPKTPPQVNKQTQPTSAVKEKVQQFEELASRVTRTKTRAMAKKETVPEDNQTPPDKMIPQKPALSVETLNKMNNMIFNGIPPQVSSSASKPRTNLITSAKCQISSSTSKLSSISRHREAAEEILRRDKEDARRKKEAMLEAKREQQKRKREEKMAAAAAARLAAEAARRDVIQRQEQSRHEKQALLDQGRLDKLKMAERKKLELARKVAETEERRRVEEQTRVQRLNDEQRRADLARRRQQEEQEAMKKEAAIMAKEIEKKQKEYIEKQKLKQRMEDRLHHLGTTPSKHYKMEPVYMSDGFQFLNSDEENEPVQRRVPAWSQSKVYRQKLAVQSHVSPRHVDSLFSVRVHSVDLRQLFPAIDARSLLRTSSAVWRTPPRN